MASESPSSEADASPSQRRRLQHKEDVRRAVLDATEALLVEDGYEGFSMRRLVERCGYTAPTIYAHFGDKRGLIDELLEQRFGLLLGRLRRVRQRDDPLETLRAFARTFVRFALRYPTHYRLLTAPRPDSETSPPAAEQAQQLFEGVVEELFRSGRLVADDAEETRQCLWALLHGVVSLKTSLPDQDWCAHFEERSIDAMLRGLVRPLARSRPDGSPRARGSSSR